MAPKPDDLEAIRTIVATLAGFDSTDQERIIRWVREKLQLPTGDTIAPPTKPNAPESPLRAQGDATASARQDIKSFVAEKKPSSDMQFAATVAYYFAFEAPAGKRKDSITADDLQDACRQVERHRLSSPIKTLLNAHASGLLDKAGERGAYKINTVGENLVAVTLPAGTANSGGKKPKRKKGSRTRSGKQARKRKAAK
jgi:hypothetical protein